MSMTAEPKLESELAYCAGRPVYFTDHCLERFRDRVFSGLPEEAAAQRLMECLADCRLSRTPPAWVNGTPRPFYLISRGGRLVFPACLSGQDGHALLAITCLSKADAEPDRITRKLREAGLVP